MHIGNEKKFWFVIILIITAFSLAFRILNHYELHTSALLYVGLPMAIAVALLLFADSSESTSWKAKYWNFTYAALIIMFASSIVLFEGFLCVLMFLPIYLGVISVVFLIEAIYREFRKNFGKRIPVHALPVLLVISSFEGVTPSLSFDRYNEVSVTKTIDLDINQIKDNLQKPINLGSNMPKFLSLFPMPYKVEAETLSEGDIHLSYFKYYRWFVTNTHEGYMEIKLADIGEHHIKTEILKDTSYLSHYLDLHGTLIEFRPKPDHSTDVTLTVSYDRKLDPAWYFSPLEEFAVTQTANYLIDKVIHREASE